MSVTPGPPPGPQWGDLRKRLVSAVLLIIVGAAEIWLGGTSFAALVVVLTGLMVWELCTITAPGHPTPPLLLAGLAMASLAAAIFLTGPWSGVALLLPAAVIAVTNRRDRWLSAGYAAAIMVAGYGLIDLRGTGSLTIWWLVLLVVASDVLGYFAGRSLGGPKFWPSVSPKKTWSGTVAGWVGAALVGVAFVIWAGAGWGLVALSVLVAFAGQMGDIWESWIKRRCGVKDSSGLIPGHGGVLDRFDALTGAIVAVMLLQQVFVLPLPGGP
jgi:phosphatidate cytidylyltransferase